MMKMFTLIAVLLLITGSWAFGQEYSARSVTRDGKKAVLQNRKTKDQRTVKKGDKIDGWLVWEITSDRVILLRKGEEGSNMIIRAEVPVGDVPGIQRPE